MAAFMLASMKLSATGHGEDPYRYFEWFLATIKGFPLISTTMVGFYALHPLVAQQTITNLFAFLTPQVTHLIDQTGSAPFSGGASTASTGLTRRTKKNKGNRTKGTWGNWPTSATPGDFAGASIQAQTPHPSLAAQREAAYVAEIQQLRALVATSDTATAFFVQQQQQHAYALQNAPSAFRPRSHYCGFHGWNNDHNGTACRAMAGDKRFTDAMKAATTHVGTGGNPKIGVPVGFIRPSPHHSFFPLDSPNVCLTCLPSLSQALGTKSCLPPPYEDTSARAETALLTRLESEGYKAPLVREAARAFPVCSALPVLYDGLDVSVLPHKSVSWSAPLVTLSGVSSVFCFPVKTDKTQQQHLRLDPYPHSNRPHPNSPSPPSRLSSSRFAHPNAFAFLASDDDVSDDEDDDGDDVSDSSSSVSDNASVFPQLILPQVSSPFSDLDLPPPL